MPALPPRHILSKSTFMRGCQCAKSLWLYKKHYNLRDQPTAQQERVFLQGTDVGLLARQLFGNGIDASPSDVFHYQESVKNTARYIAEGHKVIFEAAFQHEGILCAADILLNHNGKWYLYEVKSNTAVKEKFLMDAALQYHVITQAGLQLEDIFIAYINTGYVRCGELQLKQLFSKQSVKQQVLQMQQFISAKTNELKLVATQSYMPAITTGDHCTSPYPCDFYSFCSKDDLIEKEEKIADKIYSPEHPYPPINNLQLPFQLMDICTYRVAVPEYDGHWPYRHIPFQCSHYTINDSGEKGDYFLAENNSEPCAQFAQMLATIPSSDEPIFVYDKNFITARLKELLSDYPDYAEIIERIKARLTGLNFYHFISFEGLPFAVPKAKIELINCPENAAALWYNQRHTRDAEKTLAVHRLKEYASQRIAFLQSCLMSVSRMG